MQRHYKTSSYGDPFRASLQSPWILELDFNNMCLLLQGYPILKLQLDMASPSSIYELHGTRRTNSYKHPFSLGHAIPEKYRYDVFRDVLPCPIDGNDVALLIR